MSIGISYALESVRERVARAAIVAGRDPTEIDVIAVSKGHSVYSMLTAYGAGQRDFGENRAQEMVEKLPELPDDMNMHFVGPLQTNKVRLVRPSVVLLHSLDRLNLAKAWVKGPATPPPALLEVNIAEEPQKAGVVPPDAKALLEIALGIGVDVVGLMCIPPVAGDAEVTRKHFAALRELRDQLAELVALPVLSMGMTDDFEIAIQEGATLIRVGRAIFGDRPAR